MPITPSTSRPSGGSAVTPALNYGAESILATGAGTELPIDFAVAVILSADVRLAQGDTTTIEWLTAGWYTVVMWCELVAVAGGTGFTDAHLDAQFGGNQVNLSFDTEMGALLTTFGAQILASTTDVFAVGDTLQVNVNAGGAAASGNYQGFSACRIVKLS